MLFNYLRISFRNQLRNQGYFLINLTGLTLGILSSLFGFLWIKDELSVNGFHKDISHIYHILSNWRQSDGKIITFFDTQGTVYDAVKDQIPEVKKVCRVSSWGNNILLSARDKVFLEKGIYADPEFFQIFSFPVIRGDKTKANSEQNTIAISEDLANKYFGDENPIGMQFQLNKRDVVVTAVFKNVQANSTLRFDFVMPFQDFLKDAGYESNWHSYDFDTYVELDGNADLKSTDSKFKNLITNNDPAADGSEWLFLHPFKDDYLKSKFVDGKEAGGRIEYIRIFSGAILFLLFIACINFVNLATARAATRFKEVGVRKVNGARKSQLVFQFLAESFIITSISLFLAVILVEVLLPAFNLLTSKSVIFSLNDPVILIGLITVLIFTTVAAGLYPAFYLSSLQPSQIMKGQFLGTNEGSFLRKFLVTFQFALSVILLISTFIISSQLDFIRKTNLGFDRENVIEFSARQGISKNFESFRNELISHDEIVNLGVSNQIPMHVTNSTTSVSWQGKDAESDVTFRAILVGFDFLETINLPILKGRSFSKDFPQYEDDSLQQYIITQKTADLMGLDNPIGATISLWGASGRVVGVASDFNSRSIHTEVDPIVFQLKPNNQGMVFVKIKSGMTEQALSTVKDLYSKYEQKYPFEYHFLDEIFESQYKIETLTGKLATIFSGLAIAISCLGLFGLASFIIERRTREISIRKVLGASLNNLIFMLSSDFGKLFVLAIIIGSPLSYFIMNSYLAKFAYHADFNYWAIAITAVILLSLAMATVIYHITRAALSNPAEILRNE